MTPRQDERMCERCGDKLARHLVDDESSDRQYRVCRSCSAILTRYVGFRVAAELDPPAKADA